MQILSPQNLKFPRSRQFIDFRKPIAVSTYLQPPGGKKVR